MLDDCLPNRKSEHPPQNGKAPVRHDGRTPVHDLVEQPHDIPSSDVLGFSPTPARENIFAENSLVLKSAALTEPGIAFQIGLDEIGDSLGVTLGLVLGNGARTGIDTLG